MSTERQESKLIRNLGFWDLMAIAVGQIIGAGIMSSTGVAIGMTGTGVVLAFLMSPILTIISIFPVAILSSAAPTTGGPYRYCSRLMGKGAGLIYLLLHTTAFGAAVSQYALSFGTYFESIVPAANQHIVAMVILTLFYVMNLQGTKSAAILNKILTIALFAGLGLFVVFGLPKVDMGYVFNPEHLFVNGPMAFVATLALLSSATAGAQFIAELGGEAKDAGRNIPRVMIASTLGVGVLYVLIAIVAAGILPMEEVANQPLTLVANETMPQAVMYLFVIGGALGATSTTLNATLSWITKPLLVACDDRLLPSSLGTVSRKGIPYKLLTLFYVVGMLPLLFRFDISFITKFTTANSLLTKIMVCLALFVLSKRFSSILSRSVMKISPKAARAISVIGIIILCVLSYSLFASLSAAVVGFLAVLVIAVVIYVKTYAKNIEVENDLIIDYTTEKNEKGV
ncbi:MAG TPA: APC family permease [Candidatus Lachnoclostridium pullistercoris]|uniref:APC family permease n=1 Tax=Candidatus Lachnoclostridium pullistercoris TaxID=2838632 RepID=A0A9D2PGL2_9FIRM|nr:APC family permease [Candidatus Lachnoclostridium pullistercoris]